MKEITLQLDNQSTFNFIGCKLSSVKDEKTQLALYRTLGNKFVCHRIRIDDNDGRVCDTIEEVMGFFGASTLSEMLYTQSGADKEIPTEILESVFYKAVDYAKANSVVKNTDFFFRYAQQNGYCISISDAKALALLDIYLIHRREHKV